MRKVSFALAVGFLLAACGGEEQKPPQTPATPPATPAPAATPTTAEAPKEEAKPKETLAQLMEKSGRGMNEAFNAHDAKKVASFYTENAVVKMAGTPDETGRDAIAAGMQQLFTAFPDFKTAPSRVWVKGDIAIVEWTFTGTHQGDLFGIKGTEKKVGAQGVDVMWYTPEGLIKEQHTYLDPATMMSQIGVRKDKARPVASLPASPTMIISKGEAEEAKNAEFPKTMNTALDNKKEADFLALMTDTSEWDDMTQEKTAKGKADGKKFFKEMTTGFPDMKTTVANSWGIGTDWVIVESSWTGTHKGSFFGMQPTKKSVNVKNLDIMQVKDGKLVHGWSYSNGADFAMQLGLIKPPAPAKDAKAADPKAAKPADTKPADPKAAPAKPAEKK